MAHARIRDAWQTLSNRTDSEHEQALVRIALTFFASSYLYWSMSRDGILGVQEQYLLLMCSLYLLFSICLFTLITVNPKESTVRRMLGVLGDLGTTSVGIAVAGDAGAPLYVVLLWVIFGNGFRYGRKFLFFSAAIGTTGFATAIFVNDFWRDKHTMGIGLLVGLVVLPLYVSSLLKKLTAAGKRAEEANLAKNRFLANMSHEMRTPLNGIIGLMDLLKGTPLSAEQEELAKTIDDSAHTLLFLMQDVLDLSKIEAGKVSVQSEDFDLYHEVKHTVAILEPQARFKGISTYLHVPSNVPFLLQGDPRLLRQVLLNLLGNALKFTEKGTVGVRVILEKETSRHATIRFEVTDTGIGIAPEAQRKIFERFTQADESITRRYGGTGLGTTISKEIVEMMSGTIGLRSEQGRGSTFWFTLELAKQRADMGEVEPAEAFSGLRALVLSVDPGVSDALRSNMAGWGIMVTTVDRTAQAFAQIVAASNANVPFDFVFVGAGGIDMDTTEFARAVKSDPTIHGTRLIRVTSGREDGEPVSGDGYSSALPAPVDRTTLYNALHFSGTDCKPSDPSVSNIAEKYRMRNAGGRKLHVLVAEDNRTNQMVIGKILERAGHDARIVGNGEEALEALKDQAYDIALLDLHMPVMGGAEAAKLYRFMASSTPRMPIVALTADATPEARAECEEAGMDACLTKPIDTRILFDLFEKLVPGGAPARSSADNPLHQAVETQRDPLSDGEQAPCLDPRHLRELADLEGNSDFVVRLSWTFLKGSKEKTRELERAVADQDVERAREVAHALRGNSGQIGAIALMRACEPFSGISQEELSGNGRTYLERVKEELLRARAALDDYLGTRNSAVS